jgi:hypothetical protein
VNSLDGVLAKETDSCLFSPLEQKIIHPTHTNTHTHTRYLERRERGHPNCTHPSTSTPACTVPNHHTTRTANIFCHLRIPINTTGTLLLIVIIDPLFSIVLQYVCLLGLSLPLLKSTSDYCPGRWLAKSLQLGDLLWLHTTYVRRTGFSTLRPVLD